MSEQSWEVLSEDDPIGDYEFPPVDEGYFEQMVEIEDEKIEQERYKEHVACQTDFHTETEKQ